MDIKVSDVLVSHNIELSYSWICGDKFAKAVNSFMTNIFVDVFCFQSLILKKYEIEDLEFVCVSVPRKQFHRNY